MIRLRANLRSDNGQALVLALLFLLFTSLVVSAILTVADTSFRTTIAVRDQGKDVYAADGVVEAAIAYLKAHPTQGLEGAGGCVIPSSPTLNGITAAVTCTAAVGSGASTGGGNINNQPGQAILTLASPPEEGIFTGSLSTFTVDGPVISNSTVNVSNPNANMIVTGSVTAHSCPGPGAITVIGTKTCNDTTVRTDPGIGDSKYNPAVSAPPAAGTVPSCSASPAIPVIFTPGTYSNVTTLNNLFTSCANRTFNFTPGTYYFNFTGATPVWTVGQATDKIVAGTLDGATGGCNSALPGTQFIFGGASRWNITAGSVEMCAPPNSNSQQIAIYGLRSGVARVTSTVTGTAATSNSSPAFSNPQNALAADGTNASVTFVKDKDNKQTARLQVTGFGVSIPSGSTIKSADLLVTHRESGTSGNWDSLSYTVTPTASASVTGAGSLNTGASLVTDTFDLLAAGVNTPAKFASLSARFDVTLNKNKDGSADLDAMVIRVSYTPSGFTADEDVENGCITKTPYPGSGACALVTTGGSNTNFLIRGTVYAPLAALDIALPNQSTQIFTRGVILRSLRLQLPASSSQTAATISLPPLGTTGLRTVIISASIAGKTKIRAVVQFDDSNVSDPGKAKVISWSYIR